MLCELKFDWLQAKQQLIFGWPYLIGARHVIYASSVKAQLQAWAFSNISKILTILQKVHFNMPYPYHYNQLLIDWF